MPISKQSYIEKVLEAEGGYVDRKLDRGGPTNMGITLPTLNFHRKRTDCTAQDVEELTVVEATEIYSGIWDRFAFVDDDTLHDELFDCAVLHGPARAVGYLQQALGVHEDGLAGPDTLASFQALTKPQRRGLVAKIWAARLRTIGNLVASSPAQAANVHGWMNRISKRMDSA